jgi:hypothetical protein
LQGATYAQGEKGGAAMKPRALTNNIAAIATKYEELGSIKSTARHYGVSNVRISAALHSAGAVKLSPQATVDQEKQEKKEGCQCGDCVNATATKCDFMQAASDKAEAVLIEWGCRYKSRRVYTTTGIYTHGINLLTVLECANYAAGCLPWMMGCTDVSPERQNRGRDSHKIGGCTIFKVR